MRELVLRFPTAAARVAASNDRAPKVGALDVGRRAGDGLLGRFSTVVAYHGFGGVCGRTRARARTCDSARLTVVVWRVVTSSAIRMRVTICFSGATDRCDTLHEPAVSHACVENVT